MPSRMSFTAVGDAILQKRLAGYADSDELIREIKKGDVRFFNLETTIHDYESFPSQFSGGGWLCAPKECLEDCLALGFNLTTLANNHTLDFSYGGLQHTLRHVREIGIPCAGAGENLALAAAPAYLDTPQGRVALIAVTASFHPTAMAGEQTASMVGRPGVNGLRHSTVRYLKPEYLKMAKELAEVSGVNDFRELAREAGYMPLLPPGTVEFDQVIFREDDHNHTVTLCNKKDMDRVKTAIYEAQLQADYILISLHSHEFNGKDLVTPPQFIEEFAKTCIDLGAHGVIGHGPHILQPVEIYKGRPIFYSLGNFIFHNENMTRVPADFCTSVGLDPNSSVRDVLSARSRQFTVGWQCTPEAFEAVMPYWEMEDGTLTSLTFTPLELGFGEPRSRNGWPRISKNMKILERFAKMCENCGTRLILENGKAVALLE